MPNIWIICLAREKFGPPKKILMIFLRWTVSPQREGLPPPYIKYQRGIKVAKATLIDGGRRVVAFVGGAHRLIF